MMRKIPAYFCGPLRLSLTKTHVEVGYTIQLTEKQALSLNSEKREILTHYISNYINTNRFLNKFVVVRCDLTNPVREGVLSKYFGTIVVSGRLSLEEAATASWASSLLETRISIKRKIVEITGVHRTYRRSLGRKGSKQ